jgi:pimeloyl-ACP methyl ester carboxylesterase
MPPAILALLVMGALQAAPAPAIQKTAAGLAYERAGSGPAIVLIHGAFLDLRMWNREFDALKGKWTVVRYDLRMHGQSALPAEPFSHVADLVGLLDELKIDKAILIGLSNGAQIALDAASRRPHASNGRAAGPAITACRKGAAGICRRSDGGVAGRRYTPRHRSHGCDADSRCAS